MQATCVDATLEIEGEEDSIGKGHHAHGGSLALSAEMAS